MSKNTNQKGFTLVELLIVIVVIAILAAISIVAYNGIQNRSRASAAQQLASQVSKKIESYNAVEGSYPTLSQLTTNSGNGTTGNPAEAKLDNTSSVGSAAPTSGTTGATAGVNYVQYVPCATAANGGTIHWYDYGNSRVTTTATNPRSISVGTC